MRRGRTGSFAAHIMASLLLGGCASAPLEPPAPLPEPIVEVRAPSIPSDGIAADFDRPELSGEADELLASPVLRRADFGDEVDRWIEHWSEDMALWFPAFLVEMGRYAPTIDDAIAEHGVPQSLRYLPLIESGYSPRATSHASAVGMWQFMSPTARGFGMEVTPLVDERRDPFVSTSHAVSYLADLRASFGSWFLALAAYNAGPTRTRRILRQRAPLAEGTDSLFWALREHFPPETRDFVPKLVGAIIVAQNARAYEVYDDPADALRFDEVVVPDATSLDVAADAAGTTLDEIERLNPALIRGLTPPGRSYRLRVPPGRGPAFDVAYARIPPEDRVSFVEHVVVSGETLSHIARRYDVRLAELRAANPSVEPRLLRIGSRLTVPLAPSSRRSGLR